MKYTIVTAAIIQKNHSVLLTQRKETGKHPLQWEFPGGKLEPGEALEECLIRELQEELNMTIQPQTLLSAILREEGCLILFYTAKVIKGKPEAKDCHDFRWVPIANILSYDLTEADKIVAKSLLNNEVKR